MGVKKIVVLGTGGTIAGQTRSDNPSTYDAARHPVHSLVRGLQPPPGTELIVEQIAQIDSKDMDLAVWQALVARLAFWLPDPEVSGFIVTHGTDTLEETAFLLHRLLAPAKPVVLASAMRAADAADADGPANLRDALVLAASKDAQGVLVVSQGRVLGAHGIQKWHGSRLDALGCGAEGEIARIHGTAVQLQTHWPEGRPAAVGQDRVQRFVQAVDLPRVHILWSMAAVDSSWELLFDQAAARDLKLPPLRGLVLAGTGAGTLHRSLMPVIETARQAGVRLALATRCADGGLDLATAVEYGLDPVALTPVKARIGLMLDLLESSQQI